MGQVFNILENISPLVKASSTTITMAPTYLGMPTKITVGAQQFKASSTITLNTAAANGINALDAGALASNTLYYIYAVQSSGVLGLVASTSAPTTGPTGFGAWKEIGRFRTFVGSASIAVVVNSVIGFNSQQSNISEWIPFTPVVDKSGGTGSVVIGSIANARYRQVKSEMQFDFDFNVTVSVGTVAYIRWDIPQSLNHTGINLAVFQGGNNAGTAIPVVYETDPTPTTKLWAGPRTVTFTPTSWNIGTANLLGNISVPIAEWIGLFDD